MPPPWDGGVALFAFLAHRWTPRGPVRTSYLSGYYSTSYFTITISLGPGCIFGEPLDILELSLDFLVYLFVISGGWGISPGAV